MPTKPSKTPAKRSLAERLRARTSDLDAAGDHMTAGKAPPKVGGAYAPKSLTKKKK